MSNKCEDCRFFKKIEGYGAKAGECYYLPPSVVVFAGEMGWLRSQVNPYDLECSKFKRGAKHGKSKEFS